MSAENFPKGARYEGGTTIARRNYFHQPIPNIARVIFSALSVYLAIFQRRTRYPGLAILSIPKGTVSTDRRPNQDSFAFKQLQRTSTNSGIVYAAVADGVSRSDYPHLVSKFVADTAIQLVEEKIQSSMFLRYCLLRDHSPLARIMLKFLFPIYKKRLHQIVYTAFKQLPKRLADQINNKRLSNVLTDFSHRQVATTLSLVVNIPSLGLAVSAHCGDSPILICNPYLPNPVAYKADTKHHHIGSILSSFIGARQEGRNFIPCDTECSPTVKVHRLLPKDVVILYTDGLDKIAKVLSTTAEDLCCQILSDIENTGNLPNEFIKRLTQIIKDTPSSRSSTIPDDITVLICS